VTYGVQAAAVEKVSDLLSSFLLFASPVRHREQVGKRATVVPFQCRKNVVLDRKARKTCCRWNVRRMPCWLRQSAFLLLMSSPRYVMRPLAGTFCPRLHRRASSYQRRSPDQSATPAGGHGDGRIAHSGHTTESNG